MLSFDYETQGTMTYLVYAVDAEDVIDSMGLGMVTNNKIPGLAEAFIMQMDMNRYIKYNVSAKISVKQFFEGAVNRKRLLGVFNGIVSAMLSAQDYMINPSSILLDLKYIYTDVSTCETVLICLPVEGKFESVDLGAFFKNIMFSTQFDQTENCDHVARIINYLNSSPAFSLTDFKGVLDSLSRSSVQQQSQPIPLQLQPKQAQPQQAVNQYPQSQPVQPQYQSIQSNPTAQDAQISKPAPSRAQVIAAQQQQTTGETPQSQVHPSRKLVGPAPQFADQGGIQMPGATAKPEVQSGEKPMSFMTLMMHYSKENKEKYKAQHQAKKAGQIAAAQSAVPQMAPATKKTKKQSDAGFAMPGQSSAPGYFAIPGQNQTTVAQQQTQVQPQTAPPMSQTVPPMQQMNRPLQPAVTPKPQQTDNAYYQAQTQISQTSTSSVTPMGGNKKNFGNTTVLGEGRKAGLTTVLGDSVTTANAPRPHLLRIRNNEQVYITANPFVIGKENSFVNYFIGDNPNVSRCHANIVCHDGQYFVMDMNSTNHTYVNGGMIQSNLEVPLSPGTRIRFANEEFEFRLN